MSFKLIDLDFGEKIGQEGAAELYVCPQCAHVLRVTKSLGVLNCFYCGFGKGLRLNNYFKSFAPPIKQYNENIPKFCQALSEILTLGRIEKDYLKSRGINNPEEYGLLSTPNDIAQRLESFCGLDNLIADKILTRKDILPYALHPDRILIPYNTLFHGVVSIKSRSTPYKEIREPNCLRYTTLAGSKHAQYLYKPKKLVRNSTLIITEGEFKAIVGSQFGYNTLAIPGISFTYNVLKQVKYLSKFFKYIYIILDNDTAFHETLGPVHAYLRLLEAPNTIPIILPKTTNEKVGLDDYLLSDDGESFQELLDEGFWKKEDTTKILINLEQSLKKHE